MKLKKFLSLLLALVMTASLLILPAHAENAGAEETGTTAAADYADVALFRELLEAKQGGSRLLRAPRAVAAQNNPEGLELTKSVTDNQDGTYTITLEAYTTGAITTSTGVKPVDIVLLVDMSSSMNNSFSEGGWVYTEVYELNKNSTYYVRSGSSYKEVEWCSTCKTWTNGCFHFIVNFSGTKYTPMKSADDATSGSVQFYTKEDQQSMTRLEALQRAANTFITNVAEKGGNRMAIVGFHDDAVSLTDGFLDATENEAALKKAINDIDIGTHDRFYATDHDGALSQAEELFKTSDASAKERERVVVLFTDGEPEPSGETDWSSTTVKNAVESTYRLKNDYEAAVYCISVAPGTDAESMSSPMDQYMSYVSSNYPSARYTGQTIERNRYEKEIEYEQRVVNQITPGTPADISKGSFYLSAGSVSALENIFKQIADQTGGSSISLGSSAVVKDVVTPYFDMPDNVSDVTVQAVDCLSYNTATGDATWEATGTKLTDAVTIEGSQVNVSKFDFNRNFVSEKGRVEGDVTQAGNFHGRKLVISFTVTPKDGFLGGNGVPTNESAGVYVDPDAKEPLATATADPVNVKIGDVKVSDIQSNVYLGGYYSETVPADQVKKQMNVTCGDVTLDLTKENFGLEDWQHEYVDIVVTVKDANGNDLTDGIDSLTEDVAYTVTVTVKPKQPAGDAKEQSGSGTDTIHVFKPELTFADGEGYYGDTVPAAFVGNLTNTRWVHYTSGSVDKVAGDEGVSMLNNQPNLALTYTPDGNNIAEGKYTKEDVSVDVTVKIGNRDVTDYTTFLHTNCDGKTCNVPEGKEFLVHIKTCTLNITKAGGASDETYVFDVYKDGVKYSEVTIQGNGTENLVELPVGTYTIQEDTNWSWRYHNPTYSVDGANLNSTTPTGTITCTNTKTVDSWLNGFSTVVRNIFSFKH